MPIALRLMANTHTGFQIVPKQTCGVGELIISLVCLHSLFIRLVPHSQRTMATSFTQKLFKRKTCGHGELTVSFGLSAVAGYTSLSTIPQCSMPVRG
jgi:hypothetical protein